MNERIRLLAEQAEIWANQFEEHWREGTDTYELFKQKFAELIVAECFGEVMCQLYDYSPSSNEQYNAGHEAGLKLAVSKIKQHFGVEE